LRLFYFLELLVLAKLYGLLLFYHAMQSQMVTYFKPKWRFISRSKHYY